jgi:trans-aconitate 2-methyltransferase
VSTRYTYGDSLAAAERLRMVETVAATTRSFLVRNAPWRPLLAVDLGCGPGYTTRLLHETVGAARTVGLDRSESFVELARRTNSRPGMTFMRHDVSETPLPTGPADLLFARLLLAHLQQADALVRRWVSSVAPGGVVLLDELEEVASDEPAIRTYLDEVAIPVVRAQGAELMAGPRLHAMPDPPGLERLADSVVTLRPPVAISARIFGLNLAVLTERGEIGPRPDLAQDLAAIAEGDRRAHPVIWQMRQIAFRRPLSWVG